MKTFTDERREDLLLGAGLTDAQVAAARRVYAWFLQAHPWWPSSDRHAVALMLGIHPEVPAQRSTSPSPPSTPTPTPPPPPAPTPPPPCSEVTS